MALGGSPGPARIGAPPARQRAGCSCCSSRCSPYRSRSRVERSGGLALPALQGVLLVVAFLFAREDGAALAQSGGRRRRGALGDRRWPSPRSRAFQSPLARAPRGLRGADAALSGASRFRAGDGGVRRRQLAAALEEPEELVVGRQHQRGALAERLPVGLEAAHEGVELGVPRVGLGVDARRLGVALAALDLGVPPRLGHDHLRRAIGLGPDRARLLLALRAVLSRQPIALGAHARVDVLLGLLRQLGAIDAHVADLDAEALRRLAALLRDLLEDRVALVLQDLHQTLAADHLAHLAAHLLVDLRLRLEQAAREGAPELERIGDAPDDVVVHHDLLEIQRLHHARLGGEMTPAPVEDLDVHEGHA